MRKFYTSVILLINQSKEIGEKQFSVFGSRGGQNSPLMHVPLYIYLSIKATNKIYIFLTPQDEINVILMTRKSIVFLFIINNFEAL